MSLHHKLCHVLGGTFDLPHARTHAVILPYVAAFNFPAAPSARVALCRALRTDDPAGVLTDLAAAVGAPRRARGGANYDLVRHTWPVVDAYARRILGCVGINDGYLDGARCDRAGDLDPSTRKVNGSADCAPY
jgi:alcohol dehydrogenase class IV